MQCFPLISGGLSDTEPTAHCGGTEPAAARAADSPLQFLAGSGSRVSRTGRRSKRVEAVSHVEG